MPLWAKIVFSGFSKAACLAGGGGGIGDGVCGGYSDGAMILSAFFGRRRGSY